MTPRFKAQYKADRTTILNALRAQPHIGHAADTISSALQSRDTHDAWTDLLMDVQSKVGYEFAGNQQDYLARTYGAKLKAHGDAESEVKDAILRKSLAYAPARASAILSATSRYIGDKIDAARLAATSKAKAKPTSDQLPSDFSLDTIQDLDQMIDFIYEGFGDGTAQLLADHEVATAGNGGQYIGAALMEGLNVEKVWSAVGDNKTRPWHAEMDGVATDMDSPFDVEGEQLMYPLDDSLGASGRNLFGCRCTTYYQPAQ